MNFYNINAYKLIAAVAKRPALYNKEHQMYYCHNKYKQRLWKETCQEVIPNWELMSTKSRVQHGKELQKRWKNLRSCFTREIQFQKKEDKERKEGREVKPRKRYEHFNRMLFLLNEDQKHEIQELQNDDSNDANDDPLENMKTEFLEFEADAHKMTVEPESEDDHDVYANNDDKINNDKVNDDRINNDKVNNDKVKRNDENDDDRHFLLSLLGTFKQFNDKKKFEAKIEVLKTLKKIQFSE